MGRNSVELLDGELNVRELHLADCKMSIITVWKNAETLSADIRKDTVFFKQESY